MTWYKLSEQRKNNKNNKNAVQKESGAHYWVSDPENQGDILKRMNDFPVHYELSAGFALHKSASADCSPFPNSKISDLTWSLEIDGNLSLVKQ